MNGAAVGGWRLDRRRRFLGEGPEKVCGGLTDVLTANRYPPTAYLYFNNPGRLPPVAALGAGTYGEFSTVGR